MAREDMRSKTVRISTSERGLVYSRHEDFRRWGSKAAQNGLEDLISEYHQHGFVLAIFESHILVSNLDCIDRL